MGPPTRADETEGFQPAQRDIAVTRVLLVRSVGLRHAVARPSRPLAGPQPRGVVRVTPPA